MKVIDLLNKIANNEEVPKEIMYKTHYWKYNKERNDYRDEDNDFVFSCSNYDIVGMLNYEIEIIEEKPKKIEELKSTISYYFTYEDERLTEDFSGISKHLITNIDKINELTKAVNYLLEKESDK